MSTSIDAIIKRDLQKYYYVIGEKDECKIHLKYAGNYIDKKLSVILHFDDIYCYRNVVTKNDLTTGELEIMYYKINNSYKVSLYAILDKNIKHVYSKSMKCHFEIRSYIENEMKILKKIDLFSSDENLLYILSYHIC